MRNSWCEKARIEWKKDINPLQFFQFLSKNTKEWNGYRIELLCKVFPFWMKEVEDWKEEDVRAFFVSFGMEEEMESLLDHDFKTGFLLKAVEREDAKDMGMSIASYAQMKRWMNKLEVARRQLAKKVLI